MADIKIAIISEYYRSSNYGGNLQAYALTKFINDSGFYAEQLPYIRPKYTFYDEWKETDGLISKIILFLNKVIKKTLKRDEFKLIKKRRETVIGFGNTFIPHCECAYSDEDLKRIYWDNNSCNTDALTEYTLFITGSDQVWRSTKKEAYFLTFVPEEKKKIAYAASISKDVLTAEEQDFFRNALRSFNAISVRENSDVNLLQGLCQQCVEWVLDPTLLIDDHQWSNMCSPKLCDEKYIFCYFLGKEKEPRRLARNYAKKYGLKLLTLPYLSSEYPLSDYLKKKSETRLYDVGVEEFLSLIKNAEMVFTDSFHAAVFSGIFKRQFFIFERVLGTSMNSRIKSLVDLYEIPERFCDTDEKQKLSYLENLPPIDYTRSLDELEAMKTKSKEWLISNIKSC